MVDAPEIGYFLEAPPQKLLARVLDNYLNCEPDAIVISAYDSGMVADHLISPIQRASERGIAVFGIRATLFDTVYYELTRGREPLDNEFFMQPEMIKAGYIPLQGYPLYLLEIAEMVRKMCDLAPELPVDSIRAQVDGDKLFNTFTAGLQEIFVQHSTYDDRIAEARRRFSSEQFNARIDEILSS